MSHYTVTLYFQFPAWDEVDGAARYYIEADSKSEAIKDARRQAVRDGHIAGGARQGRVTLKVTNEFSDELINEGVEVAKAIEQGRW